MVIHYFCRDGHWPYKLLDRDVSSPRFASRSLSRSLERQLAQICRWAALRLQAWNVTFQERLRVVEKLGTCDLFVTSDGGFTISSREYRRFLSFLISYISNVYIYIYIHTFFCPDLLTLVWCGAHLQMAEWHGAFVQSWILLPMKKAHNGVVEKNTWTRNHKYSNA